MVRQLNIRKVIVSGKKTINYLKKNGLRHTFYAAKERMEQEKADNYSFVGATDEELLAQRIESEGLLKSKQGMEAPLFSLLVPTFETKREFFFCLLDSIRLQSYPKWELILADASRTDQVKKALDEYCLKYKNENASDNLNEWEDLAAKIVYVPLEENKGISDNTNAGLAHCKGDYICLVDHDDLLTQDALYYFAKDIMNSDQKDVPVMIYSDEDKTNTEGTVFYDYNDKYKFNLDLILSNNYICHLTAIKADVFKKLKERPEYDGAQDYDLVLRVVSEILPAFWPGLLPHLQKYIHHIPRVLYHWRCHSESTAENTASKRYAYEAGLRAVKNFMDRHNIEANVTHSLHLGFYQVEYVPSLLKVRADIAAVGGRILDRHKKMKACIQNSEGDFLYVGTHKEYSGRMHRFSMLQDVACIDLRCAKLSEKAVEVLSNQLRTDCKAYMKDEWFDAKTYEKKCGGRVDWETINQTFCKQLTDMGYTIVYDPKFEMKG